MPRLKNAVPKYRKHRASGQAIVCIESREFYLGPHGTKASRLEYDRIIGEWLAAGRQLPHDDEGGAITVSELLVQYLRYAKSHFTKNGKPTGAIYGVKVAARILRNAYGHTLACDFGPLSLKALQRKCVDLGQSRNYVNGNIDRIRRIFKWGASEELVPASVFQSLRTVPGLRKGRSEARETAPVMPVDDATVDATMPHLPAIVADMVKFQRLTGARPGEICTIRPCDVDTSGDVWRYRPESHKTEHHDRERVICIGPKAQDVLRPYLLRDKTAYCFSPAESERRRLALAHAARKTPLSCGNRPGTNRRRKPKTKPGDRYDANSYRRTIHRAVGVVNKSRAENNSHTELLPKWSPNRLRHAMATETRRRFGLEHAQVALGHSKADITEIYAEKNLELGDEVARKIG